ncbi:hypothetical protein A9Q83_10040 [Alphaproteobacteria bacterium 46_93_T64]|nr:hypothetical protein A9Q83_10040 [Alphaproteobacteria bacterium 46_93_T64]
MKTITASLCFVFILVLTVPSAVKSDEMGVMKFSTAAPLGSDLEKLTTLVLTEAFKRLGYSYEVESYPQKRGIYLMRTGRVDGDATRVYGFNKEGKHPYYVRVNESHAAIFFDAFVTDPKIKITSWEDLKNGNYRVGYLEGVKFSEQHLIGFIDKDKLISQPNSNLNGLKQLVNGRTDVYIYADGSRAKNDMADEELKKSTITFAGHVDRIDLYPYLQKKHEPIADILTATIRDIKKEGLFEIFQKQVSEN